MKKNLIIGSIILTLLSGSGGVYAGTLINKGKTPRGNSYSEEKATIEHNKYEVNLDKTKIGNTISMNKNVYVNIKNLPPSKFNLNYNKSKWSYNLVSNHDEIDKLKLQLNQSIADVKQAQAQTDEVQKEVDELSVGKVTSTLSAKVNGNSVVINYTLQNHTEKSERYKLKNTPCSPMAPSIFVYDSKGKLVKSNISNSNPKKGTVCAQVIVEGILPPGGVVRRSLVLKNVAKGQYSAKASLGRYPKTIKFEVN